MKVRLGTWRRVATTAVVAIGLAVVWGVVLGWSGTLASLFFSNRGSVIETLAIALDGTPIVIAHSNIGGRYLELSRRTLDGKQWPQGYRKWLSGANLSPRQQAPGLFRMPITWFGHGNRIGCATDGNLPPTTWYLIRDDEPAGHCYLSGFDATSKLPVGTLGRSGFRETVPTKDNRFALPNTNAGQLIPFVVSRQYIEWSRIADNSYMPEQSKPPGTLIFVAENDGLWEVDLRQRTTRGVTKLPDIVSIGMMEVPESLVQRLKPGGEARLRTTTQFQFASMMASTGVLFNTAASPEEETKYVGVVAMRTADRVVMFDPTSGNRTEFKLPSDLPGGPFMVIWVAPDKLLLNCYNQGVWSGGRIDQLVWIDPTGKIERQERVNLAGPVPESPRTVAWNLSAVAPIPVAWLAGVVVGSPITLLQQHDAADYASALRMTADIAWPPLIVVIAVSIALAWLAMRWQRKYHRPATALWVTFVFLLGLPGLVAYWLEQRRAKLESCPSCGQVVPRDREACAACDAAFPTPPLVGTEILA